MRRLTPFGASEADELCQLLRKADHELNQARSTTLAAYYVSSAADWLERAVNLLTPSVFPSLELTRTARRKREHTDRACAELRKRCKEIVEELRELGVKDGQSLNGSDYALLNYDLHHLERMAEEFSQAIRDTTP